MNIRTTSTRRRLAWTATAAMAVAIGGAGTAHADVIGDNPSFVKEVTQLEQRLLTEAGRGDFTCGTHPVAILGCVDATGKLWTGDDLAAIVPTPEWQALVARAPAGFPIAFKVVKDPGAAASSAKRKTTRAGRPASKRHVSHKAAHR